MVDATPDCVHAPRCEVAPPCDTLARSGQPHAPVGLVNIRDGDPGDLRLAASGLRQRPPTPQQRVARSGTREVASVLDFMVGEGPVRKLGAVELVVHCGSPRSAGPAECTNASS